MTCGAGMIMFDDFFIRALFAGIGLAIIVGPLGCLIIWRKMAFFGDTLAHAALLGIALAILIDISPLVGVPLVTLASCISLMIAKRTPSLSSDTILAILAHSTLALGLVLISLTGGRSLDVNGLLFGDILAVDTTDLLVIYAGGGAILAIIIWQWRRLIAATLSPEIAEAEGLSPQRAEWLFMMLIALVVSIAVKLVGVLLITALMIIPAAAARRLVSSPEMMAGLASLLGVIGVIAGLYGSAEFDIPSGPAIILAGGLLLLGLSFVPRRRPANANMRPHTHQDEVGYDAK
jgi:zinc transport system permease protein